MAASQIARDWSGIHQFPSATQSKLHVLLAKLKADNVSTLTVLVMGKGGVGKSSTVNTLLGERAASVSAFQSEGLRPMMCSRILQGFTLNIIDTPGLVEGGCINDNALKIIKGFLLNKTIDVLMYVDRLDAYRVDTLDRQVVKAITDAFGKGIWRRSLVVLTHAQVSPPDGLDYGDFYAKRSEGLLKVIRMGARIKLQEFQSEGLRPMMCSRTLQGFTLNIIDTPGLVEGGCINDNALKIIKGFLLNKTIDVLMYVDRLDVYRVDTLDRQVVKAITDAFGRGIWRRSLVVLTHAQVSPPDGLDYGDFYAKRSEGLLKVIRIGARIKLQEFQESAIPVVLVENTGRCNKNVSDEKIVPDGTPMIPNLVKVVIDVISNGSKPITVDQKLIDGPDPNAKGKFLIPFILAFQYFALVKPFQRAIKDDILKESKPLWELRDMGLANREF